MKPRARCAEFSVAKIGNRKEPKAIMRVSRIWGKAPHKAPHVLFPPYSTNPSPRASMTIRLTAMETEFVKLASAVSLWQRSV